MTTRMANGCVAALLVVVGLAARPARGQAPVAPARGVTTTGDAVVYVTPDEVIVSLGVETFEKELERAKAENDERSARLVKSIKALGVEEKHLRASHMEVELAYADGSHPSKGIEGYHARRQYEVTLKEAKGLERLIDAALKGGANRLNGVDFRTSELRKHRDEARRMATRAAREKAVSLCAELGCKIGAPQTVAEGPVDYWGWNYGRFGAGNAAQQVAQGGGGGGGAAEGGETLPLGQMAVRAQVTVTFDLIP